jgi:hypothetical protein
MSLEFANFFNGQLPSPWTGPAIDFRRRKLWSTVHS